jgi:hypothetical protein
MECSICLAKKEKKEKKVKKVKSSVHTNIIIEKKDILISFD